MKDSGATHVIEYVTEKGKNGTYSQRHLCYGKTDLFNVLRSLMNDGYSEFKIYPRTVEKL